jgi:hypothetical protein
MNKSLINTSVVEVSSRLQNELSMFSKQICQNVDTASISVTFGTTYDDPSETHMCFSLKLDSEFIVIDDNGQTFEYLNKVFELEEPDVLKNITAITEFYRAEITGEAPPSFHITMKVDHEADLLVSLLHFHSCISFLNVMKIFYV